MASWAIKANRAFPVSCRILGQDCRANFHFFGAVIRFQPPLCRLRSCRTYMHKSSSYAIMKPLTLMKKCELYCCIIFENVYFIAYDICIVFHSGPCSLANLQHLIIECTTSLREVAARKWNKENSVVCSYEFYYLGLEGQKIILCGKKSENLNDWGWVSLFPASCSFSCFL